MQPQSVNARVHPATGLASGLERAARAQALRLSCLVAAAALSLAVCMWGFIGWSVWSEDHAARENGRIRACYLTTALANEVTLTLDAADASFPPIEAVIKAPPPDAGPGSQAGAARMAKEIPPAAGPGVEIRITGPDGGLLFSTFQRDPASPGPGAGDRGSRRGHHDDAESGLVLDEPVPADATATYRIAMSKRLDAAGGGFAGEIMLLLPADKLIRPNREIDIRRNMIAITGLDGTIRAGYDRDHPDGSRGVGTDLRGAPYPEDLAPDGTAGYSRTGDTPTATFKNPGPVVTVRRPARYPANVLVALDDDVAGPVRGHLWNAGLFGAGASVLIAALSAVLVREFRRRTRREIELSRDRDRLALAHAQLEADRDRLAEANRRLMASKESADAANQAKSRFLAHMSHELRTPLHAIIGFSELIKDQAPSGPGAPPIAGYARDIWTSGRHLLELINSILDISKVESGTATLAESLFSIEDLVRSSLASVRAQAQASGITIEVNGPAGQPSVWADRTRLQQVLINLMSNAVKFTPDNGRIVLAIDVTAGGELVLSVSDSGIGMTEADIEVALVPFGQVDNRLSRSFEGTGLGLPLAHRLTELHGGRLELKSIKGRGTIATVTLPAGRIR